MKFTVEQSVLKAAIASVSSAIPERPTHPILGCIAFKADKEANTVSLSGFDLTYGVQVTLSDVTVEESGAACLQAKITSTMISKLTDETLKFSVEEVTRGGEELDTSLAEIKWSNGSLSVSVFPVTEFPDIPYEDKDTFTLEIPTRDFIKAIAQISFAASSDETKQILQGIAIDRDGHSLSFTATNGHFLATTKLVLTAEAEIPEAALKFRVVPKAEYLDKIQKIATSLKPKEDDVVTLMIGNTERSGIVFTVGSYTIYTRLLEGGYPQWQQLIPQSFNYQIVIDTLAFKPAIDIVLSAAESSIQSNASKTAVLDFVQEEGGDPAILTVETLSKEVDAKQSLSVESYQTINMRLALNCRYLMAAAKVIRTDTFQLNINMATNPVTINPIGGEKTTILLMPVHIREEI